MGKRRLAVGGVALSIFAAVAAACSSSGNTNSGGSGTASGKKQAASSIHMVFGSPSIPNFATVPYNYGVKSGAYRKAGLDVSLSTIAGTPSEVAALISGHADVGLVGSDGLVVAVAKGQPLRSIAAFNYSPDYEFIFFKGSKVQSPSDLKGARIGVNSSSGTGATLLAAALAQHGIAVNDVRKLPIGFGAESIAAVKTNKVDVLFFPSVFIPSMQAADIPTHTAPGAAAGKYMDFVFASPNSAIKSKADALRTFLKVTNKLIEDCTATPTPCVEAAKDANPEAVPDVGLMVAQWKIFAATTKLPAEAGGVRGYQSNDLWQTVVDTTRAGGELTGDPPDLSALFTSDLLGP